MKKQTTLNGRPLWKAKHSELTAYCKKHAIENITGLKTYQIASIVKTHLNSPPAIEVKIEKAGLQERA